jgi:small subunit ribosomal protein S6
MPRLDPIHQYEIVQIWPPDLPLEAYEANLREFEEFLQKNGVKIINQEVWGLRRLAYPIKKKLSGYYVYTEFQAPASFIKTLQRYIELQPHIMRHLIVKLNKHAIEYNRRRQEKLKAQQSPAEL